MSLSAYRVPPRPVSPAVIDGSPTIVMARLSCSALKRRSLSNPGALVVDIARYRVARDGIIVEVGRPVLGFVVALAARLGAIVPADELADLLWADDPDGGPGLPSANLNTLAHRARPALAALGYRIETNHTRGRWLRCCLSPVTSQEPSDGPH